YIGDLQVRAESPISVVAHVYDIAANDDPDEVEEASSPTPLVGEISSAVLQIFDLDDSLLTSTVMFDDGNHGDASSGDGIWAAQFTPSSEGSYRYHVEVTGLDPQGRVYRRSGIGHIVVEPTAIRFVDSDIARPLIGTFLPDADRVG